MVKSDGSQFDDYAKQTIAARNCTEVLEMYVSDQTKRESMLKEFNDSPFLCPDLAEYDLFLSAWKATGAMPFSNFAI